jgi:uncharacterized membrane protein
MNARRWGRLLLALLFIAAGALHFLNTAFYVNIVPPYLPHPRELVLLSGIAEILGGCGVLVPRARRAAGWGLVLLLLAVFPANLHMAQEALRNGGLSPWTLLLLVRLPLQLALIAWVERATRPDPTPAPLDH